MKEVTIIGGGFSGLTLAYALLQRKVPVRVLEQKDRLGGLINTLKMPEGLVETAAPSFNRTTRVDRLIKDLGLTPDYPSKSARKRLFFSEGQLRSWPLSFFETVALVGKYFFHRIKGDLKPLPQESLQAWGERCLTKKATDRLLATAMQGVYAGDARELSALLLLGHLFKPGREKFRGVVGVQGGMGQLIAALRQRVLDSGGKIETQTNAEIQAGLPTVIATSAAEAARLTAKLAPEISLRAKKIQMLPLVTATVFYPKPTGPKAFGCLVKRGEGLRVLGVLLNHAIFDGRDPMPSETWIYGGATDPEFAKKTEAEILTTISTERKKIFGKEDVSIKSVVTIWPEALPHYNLQLEQALEKFPLSPNLWMHGNWLGGIGLSRILTRSEQLAEQIQKELS